MENKIDQLFGYIQERCLWQFYSRTWDREENIENILNQAEFILTGQDYSPSTPAERCFLADAKTLASDFKNYFPWISESSAADIKAMFVVLKEKLIDTTVTHSKNRELNYRSY